MLKKLFPLLIIIIIISALLSVYFLFFPPRYPVSPAAKQPVIGQNNNEATSSRLLPSEQEKEELGAIKAAFTHLNNDENRRILTDNKIYEYALTKQSASACAAMENQDNISLCLFNLAQANLKEEFCVLIANQEGQTQCQEQIIFSRARQTKDPSWCAHLEADKQKQCQSLVIAPMSDPQECEIFADTEAKMECQSAKIYQQAMSANDQKLCLDIPWSWQKANCLADFLKIDVNSDQDNDGLKYYEEIQYGTDPDKADTDGDAYTDQEEINGGFNPLGSGRAEVPASAQ